MVLLTAQHERAQPSLIVALVTSVGEQTSNPQNTWWKNKEKSESFSLKTWTASLR
jgi:hypothetical protein